MKNLFFLVVILGLTLATTTVAQTSSDYRIGIKLAPLLSFSKTNVDGNITSIERDGSSTRFMVGAFIDIPFTDNYFFSGGINYAAKVTNVLVADIDRANTGSFSESYDHEFLQVPLLLKLYTNEITLDTKLFVNFGIVPELSLNTTNDKLTTPSITAFRSFDLSGNFGLGLERAIGVNTNVFLSAGYYLGFLNQVKETSRLSDDISIKNNLVSLELGIKF